MASNIPEITISAFKALKVDQIKKLKTCEVFADGKYLFTFLNPQDDNLRVQAEGLGQLSNSIAGKDITEV